MTLRLAQRHNPPFVVLFDMGNCGFPNRLCIKWGILNQETKKFRIVFGIRYLMLKKNLQNTIKHIPALCEEIYPYTIKNREMCKNELYYEILRALVGMHDFVLSSKPYLKKVDIEHTKPKKRRQIKNETGMGETEEVQNEEEDGDQGPEINSFGVFDDYV